LRNWSKPTRPLRLLHSSFSIAFSLAFGVIALASSAYRVRAQALLFQPPRSQNQTSGAVPIAWADQLRALGDLAARISPPPGKLDLLVSNMSSLSANEVAAIDEWLRTNLGDRRFLLVEGEPVDAHLKVTLSEGTEGYLLVAQVRRGVDEQVAIFPVPRPPPRTERVGGVALTDELIWEQPGKVLDFALLAPGAGELPTLIVLEVGRIAFYVRTQGQWQLNGSVTIPPMRPWLRAPRGYIDLSRGLRDGSATLSGVECKGDFAHPGAIQCSFVSEQAAPWAVQEAWKSKNLASAGDAALLSLVCDGWDIALATGSGDWTQTDFVQGYELGTLKGQGATVSGNPLELGGPVTALWPTGASGLARAVVQNLQTGNYEAHLVRATCSQ
jgi:hypothetical protein